MAAALGSDTAKTRKAVNALRDRHPGRRALLGIAVAGSTDVTDLIETVGLDRRGAWNV